jgi:uncharacterized protein (TIGR02284 family)
MDRLAKEMIRQVNQLISLCIDRESALETAADGIGGAEQRKWLLFRAGQWAELRHRLHSTVGEPGEPSGSSGSVSGALHCTWLYIKSTVKEREAIRTECRRRETAALRNVREIRNKGLPEQADLIVEQFLHQLSEDDDRRVESVFGKDAPHVTQDLAPPEEPP